MSTIQTIYGATINQSISAPILNLTTSTIFHVNGNNLAPLQPDTWEAENLVKAFHLVGGEALTEAYYLKSDCVKIKRPTGNIKYVTKPSIPFLETINYKGKDLYFLSKEHRFNAGFVYGMAEQRWLDLKLGDRDLIGNLIYVNKANDSKDYVVNIYSNVYASLTGKIVATGDYKAMNSVSNTTFRSYLDVNHPKVIWDNIRGDFRMKHRASKYVLSRPDSSGNIINLELFTTYSLCSSDSYSLYLTDAQKEIINKFDGGVRRSYNFHETIHNGVNYFDPQSAEYNGLALVYCPHCNSRVNESSHDFERCEERHHKNPRFDYHTGSYSVKTIDIPQSTVFRIGVEIEKQSYFGSKHSNMSILNRFGWKKERDGSLCDTIGYELVSPCYPLFTEDLINEAKAIESEFPQLIDGNDFRLISSGKNKSSCGGHIHFSRSYTGAEELFEMISGYMPIIYAIYKKRANTSYSMAKEKYSMKNSNEKFQAVRIIKDDINPRIEFRIFPLVENIEQLQWRIELLRIIANNPSNRYTDVANMLCDKSSDLYKHFAKIFPHDKIKKRLLDSIKFAQDFDRDFRSFDFSDIRARISAL